MHDVALVADALDRVCPAVDAVQHPAVDELAQVAAYGLGGHVQGVGELAHVHLAVVPGAGEDLSLTLVGFHLCPLRRPRRIDLGVTRVTTCPVSSVHPWCPDR